MGGRKETPDVLANLGMGRGGGESNIEASKRHAAKALRRHKVEPSEMKEKPFKLTSYIDPDLNDDADMAVVRLKKRVGRITKSMLVEEALRICLADPSGSGLETALKERKR